MTCDQRTVSYDAALGLEAFQFSGFDEPFPQHVHDHYVFGLVESGERQLICDGMEYRAQAGDMLIFNPGEAHGCVQVSDEPLVYRGINVPQEALTQTIAAKPTKALPRFASAVITDDEATTYFRALHQAIMAASPEVDCADAFGKLIAYLFAWYADGYADDCGDEIAVVSDDTSESTRRVATRQEVEKACAYIERHCCEQISLDELCAHINVGKSTLMRAFVKEKGITPYLYVESMRIERARTLLEAGTTLAEAAARTGFSDQSHFSHYFKRITGLTPGAYRSLFMNDATSRKDTSRKNATRKDAPHKDAPHD